VADAEDVDEVPADGEEDLIDPPPLTVEEDVNGGRKT
jgi:hypothetical protein